MDQPRRKNEKGGIFLKYKIIAVIAVVVLIVVIAFVLLAAFLGPGRKRSEDCDNSNGGPQASVKTGNVTFNKG